jgi:hypothetical protein
VGNRQHANSVNRNLLLNEDSFHAEAVRTAARNFLSFSSFVVFRHRSGIRLRILAISAGLGVMLACAGASIAVAAGGDPPTHLYWGDVHLHTNYSWDAYGTGNTSITPDQAYRFARGLPVIHPALHSTVRIRRPLDFLAVTDHAIMLGTQVLLDKNDPKLLATDWGKRLLATHQKQPVGGVMGEGGRLQVMGGPDVKNPERAEMMGQVFSSEIREQPWETEIEAAENNYQPGKFTTLIGWEWTSTPGSKNLHRCVITNADGAAARKFLPFSNYDSLRPEDLWKFFTETGQKTGVDFISIPHNSNLSGGLMFDVVDSDGRPISADYARQRMRWETAVEISQGKGTSEVLPQLAPTDEFANFEIWQRLLIPRPMPASPHDYVRSALLEGLDLENKVGANPYKFGVIGATDSHTGLSTVQESDFQGHFVSDATPARRLEESKPGAKGGFIFPDWKLASAGRAAVWATENTRQGIFNAFKRKEVYGTSGTRIVLRFFGGFNFRARDAKEKDIASVGYEKGVPMGGDLTNAPRNRAPSFLIYAAKDPLSGNLDRVQIIKGWLDDSGQTQEHVYNVAWSGDRKLDTDGKLPAVGNTVDEKTGSYTNSIGAAQLATVWQDPDFNPGQRAFYYVRVLEIPTPRHSLYDAIALGIPVSETNEPASIQERAWSSPIWYTPASK